MINAPTNEDRTNRDEQLDRERKERDAALLKNRKDADVKAREKRAEVPKRLNSDEALLRQIQEQAKASNKNITVTTGGTSALDYNRLAEKVNSLEMALRGLATKIKDTSDTNYATNNLMHDQPFILNQLDALVGVTDPTEVQWATRLDRDTPYVTKGSDRMVKISSEYCAQWTVAYKSTTSGDPSVTIVDKLTIRKGYFNFGKFRAIATSDHELNTSDYSDGDYIIVARLNACATEVPTVVALTAAEYTDQAPSFGYDGVAGQYVIATATISTVGGNKVWSNLSQSHYGEIFVDKYDPQISWYTPDESTGGAIEWVSATQVLINSVYCYPHASPFYAEAVTTPTTITPSTGMAVFATFDKTTGVISITTSNSPASTDTATSASVLLWYIATETWGFRVTHMHYGAVHFWGDYNQRDDTAP